MIDVIKFILFLVMMRYFLEWQWKLLGVTQGNWIARIVLWGGFWYFGLSAILWFIGTR